MGRGEDSEPQNDARLTDNGREHWDRFVIENNGSFLQSWEWGEFQQNVGRDVRRFVFADGEMYPLGEYEIPNTRYGIRGAVQFIEMSLPLGFKYRYAPRGPVISSKFKIKNYLESLKTVIPGNVVFLRFDPAWQPETESLFLEHGWRRTDDIQPRRNWVLDITRPEDELLAAMHPKTRYNIRIAENKCIVRQSEKSDADVKTFLRLVAGTGKRHAIRPHPDAYYKKMLQMPIAELWQAEHGGEIIASHIVIFFGNRATYLHGASSYEHRALMAPHLLHWAAIQKAKRRGLTEYDFGGVDETRWPGLTRFKKGFGGIEVSGPG